MKFNLAIPGYDERSAGVRVCWYLHTLLNLAGYETVTDWSKPAPDDITVYPDCVPGNPLEAARVVRYMLFFAESYFGKGPIPAEELAIPYADYLVEDLAAHYLGKPVAPLPIPCIEPGLFYPEEKTVDSVLYTGKLTVAIERRPPHEMPVITRTSHTRPEMAALLRKAKNLYTLDHHTAMAAEAKLCGARVWLVDGPEDFRELDQDPTPWVMDLSRDARFGHQFAETCILFFGVDGKPVPP